ncbi:uncharacterized protein LOC110979287 isoform X2 [Acanthaster planci]|uniref:Uncharacterized protein LOC110979287 isoform X2 n=1 Tax=Acanthaster planci TaxID=133434 RepID=A0A8B7YBN4_ACAPL|nr:uncharacterized protein LOC110979287 isoform X2 [Acanthaster planci]
MALMWLIVRTLFASISFSLAYAETCWGPGLSSKTCFDDYYCCHEYTYDYDCCYDYFQLSVGAIVGIVIGSLIFLGIIIAVIVALCCCCCAAANSGNRGRPTTVTHVQGGVPMTTTVQSYPQGQQAQHVQQFPAGQPAYKGQEPYPGQLQAYQGQQVYPGQNYPPTAYGQPPAGQYPPSGVVTGAFPSEPPPQYEDPKGN